MIHKPSLANPDTFKKKEVLYFYYTRYLLERVSWLCRDAHASKNIGGDGTADIIFSNRSCMSYDNLRDYFEKLRPRRDVKIDWGSIGSIRAVAPTKSMGLMIADAVASGFSRAVETRYGQIEDRYARMLKPVVYSHQGKWINYGIKLVGADASAFEWLRASFTP
jgi:hypothetical protein